MNLFSKNSFLAQDGGQPAGGPGRQQDVAGKASRGHQDPDARGSQDRQDPPRPCVPSSLQHCPALHLTLSQVACTRRISWREKLFLARNWKGYGVFF